ncbi:MAG: hypothetical protein F9K30_12060 [Dechloromonas sp.]|nr:MAG: hypothetical protein F9K30_12060 [Dechloromonas sp.]
MTYKTRADLMRHPAFAALDLNTDGDGNPCVWENHYSCRACTSEQVDWTDTWSCQCDDECPECGDAISPYRSKWVGPSDPVFRPLWEGLPEAEGQGCGASLMPDDEPAVFDLSPEQHAMFDAKEIEQREIARQAGLPPPFDAAEAVDDAEIRYRFAPVWAWRILDEAISKDVEYRAISRKLRNEISDAFDAMIVATDNGDLSHMPREVDDPGEIVTFDLSTILPRDEA